ncbi:MAG: hypothetical protein MZV70_16845 [Desulfobacterales bacterium]|nr:hypothetical protein [Desulfobacterales bacterium]
MSGNLENVLYRMAVPAGSDTPLPPAGEASAESFAGSEAAAGITMRDVEREMIIKTLKAMKGSRTRIGRGAQGERQDDQEQR